MSDDDRSRSSMSSSVLTGYLRDNWVNVTGSQSCFRAVTVMVGIGGESRRLLVVIEGIRILNVVPFGSCPGLSSNTFQGILLIRFHSDFFKGA